MPKGEGYDPDELLTIKYLAEITHVSQKTIFNYIKKYEIPIFKHLEGYRGHYKIRIRREDWRLFLYQHYNNAKPSEWKWRDTRPKDKRDVA